MSDYDNANENMTPDSDANAAIMVSDADTSSSDDEDDESSSSDSEPELIGEGDDATLITGASDLETSSSDDDDVIVVTTTGDHNIDARSNEPDLTLMLEDKEESPNNNLGSGNCTTKELD